MKKVLVIVVGLLGAVGFWWWSPKPVEVTRVVDGDTIELIDGRRIRYINVDTPEVDECFRAESIKMNEELVMGKKVRIEYDYDKIGKWGRELAYVYADGKMVNEELLKMGAGEFQRDNNNHKYEERLITVAENSKEEKRGLWSVCGEKGECLIKGNIDRNDVRYYHLPTFRHYEQVVMRLDLGDKWFCSEEEAIKKGFTRARE
ncbi:MAG: thermonuclease family protein [Candidatus Beckwithbacteria bacterium]|nr:thermonuclease family protein [Patescibacteria group bacterium]